MLIRQELESDRRAIHTVLAAAFGRPAEADLVDALREQRDTVTGLSLVAELDGEVVGHVVCSRARIGDDAALGLGPLGVAPSHQGTGIGSALMHAVVAAADALGHPVIVLLGDPGYYRRFGFVAARAHGVHPPVAEWVPYFQLRTLTTWNDRMSGAFRYAPAFDAV